MKTPNDWNAEWQSSYRLRSYYYVWKRGEWNNRKEVVYYYATPEQYREDYKSGVWNYTPQDFEQEIVHRAGLYCWNYGETAPTEIADACRDAKNRRS